MPSCCFVPGCKSNYRPNRNIRVFKFPDDPDLRGEWLNSIQRKDLQPGPRSVVCINHFKHEDVVKEMVTTKKDGSTVVYQRERYRLKPDAVPTIFPDTSDPDVKLCVEDPGLESELHAWVIEMIGKGHKVTPGSVGAKARELGLDRGLGSIKTDRFWCTQFFRRNKLVYDKGSGTVAKEEKDPLPLEPTVEIKEEPVDYDPNPSTSIVTANDEFILPHRENWTTPDAAVEPQITLSVACLAPSNEPGTPNGEQPKKKRKSNPTKITTSGSSTNGTEAVKPQCSFDDFSDSNSSFRKDQFDVFGEYIAAKLRSLDRRSSSFAQKAIADIIFEAEMGKYLKSELEDSDSATEKSLS